MNTKTNRLLYFVLLLIGIFICSLDAIAEDADWKRHEVDLRLTGGNRVKAVYYPDF